MLTAIVFYLLLSGQFQATALSEKQAVAAAQQVFASELETKLPTRPFVDWFREVLGPQAGVTWQLNECGDHPSILIAQGRELPACAEVNALLPDGRKVIVMILVGTFKNGITGNPQFYHAAMEQEGQLYQIQRLQDLPERLRSPGTLRAKYSDKLVALDSYFSRLPGVIGGSEAPSGAITGETAPPPQPPVARARSVSEQTPPEEGGWVSESVLLGSAISKVQPIYPANAKKVNASGRVQVQVTISVEGRVIEATAISGHPLLRGAAIAAAGKWLFKPTMMNGVPVKVQSVLTFVFTPSD
jgi:TonB family protein